MNKKPPQNSQQYQRVGAGQYRMGNGPIINAANRRDLPQGAAGQKPGRRVGQQPQMQPPGQMQPMQRPTPGNMPQMPQGWGNQQPQFPEPWANGQFNQGQMQDLAYRFPPGQGPNPQQIAQIYGQFNQGVGYGQGGQPMPFDQAAQQNQIWRKTQAPDQAMGILAGMPPGYNQRG